ncbi:MAG TPA: hypothetical protein VMU09_08405 [Acidimicrobiales bacterium]|nr:hypothetical protein [Acidimicrobiales bacterium]
MTEETAAVAGAAAPATRSAPRVLLLTVIDQGASSLSNFALAVLVAHYSGAHTLGVFAILTSTYILCQGLVRSFTSDCLLTRPEADPEARRLYERSGYLASLTLSCVAALCLLAASPAMGPAFALPFVVFALSFPTAALQDYARFIGISRHDPAYAIRLDVAWLVLFLAGYLVLRSMGFVTFPWLFGAWIGTGAAVGLWTVRAHLPRAWRRSLAFWFRSERSLGWRFAGQFMLSSVSTYLIFYVLAFFVITVAEVGTIKLSQLAIGPIVVVITGAQSALVTLAARRFHADRTGALGFLLVTGILMAGVVVAWTALVYLAPVHLLRRELGPAWPGARALVPFTGLTFVMAAFSGAAIAGLRALRAARENLLVALAMLPVVIAGAVIGAEAAGARGCVIGSMLAAAVTALTSWIVLVRTARRADAPAAAVDMTERGLPHPNPPAATPADT